ncbi:MAG TPA: phenylphosphate carboxylase subunit delta [Acidobacteriota bacterium]|jgi:3-deoxy-D-manno-octulosonate 8-phosphate phosphatase (KDO 8-P phosphatase)|nr:phenylphosphate carboxylase subunit delta [Acidobacteriota bacterium]
MLTYSQFIAKLKPIRLLLLDVDGVMTDNKIYLTGAGDERKGYSSLDGHGIRMAQRIGLQVGFLTGRISEGVIRRAEDLDIKILAQRSHQKEADYEKILREHGFTHEEVAYMGDDVVDLPVLSRCGFSVVTPDAEPWIQNRVCYVTRRRGGEGAVREVIDLLLKAQDKWEEAVGRYIR